MRRSPLRSMLQLLRGGETSREGAGPLPVLLLDQGVGYHPTKPYLLFALGRRRRNGESMTISLLTSDQIGAQARLDLSFLSRMPTKIYHVAKNGFDTDLGTQALPWKTIGKVTATLGPGHAVYVYTRTYYERVTTSNPGTSSAPIWLMEAPGENVVIKGTRGPVLPAVRSFALPSRTGSSTGSRSTPAARLPTRSASMEPTTLSPGT
jgi:hypothetical protein